MSALKGAIAETGARTFPGWADRRTAVQIAAAKLPNTLDASTCDVADGEALVLRARTHGIGSLRPTDQRRALPFLLRDAADGELALACIDALCGKDRRSDAAIIRAWISEFPVGPVGEQLAAAARIGAERHDWPWRNAGPLYALWDREAAPRTLATALLRKPEDVAATFSKIGLRPGQLGGGLAVSALHTAADLTAESASAAQRDTTALLDLADALANSTMEVHASTARGILKPWADRLPPDELLGRAQRWLLKNIGDPRRDTAAWTQVTQTLAARGIRDGETLPTILRRWQVRESFDFFFRIIGQTTKDREAWTQREKFWRWFVDRNLVTDAWFVLGIDAERQAKPQLAHRELIGRYGRHEGNGDASTSALLMQIGELIISEWTHNGSCCVWEQGGPERPQFGRRIYGGALLRNSERMQAASKRQAAQERKPENWRAFAHQSGWERRVGNHISDMTGNRHPSAR